MSAAKHRSGGPAPTPGVNAREKHAIVLDQFRQDLSYWIGSEPRTALRIMRLIEEVLRDPFVGIGKPEALKYGQRGRWSRRITEADRLVYAISGTAILFFAARFHYDEP